MFRFSNFKLVLEKKNFESFNFYNFRNFWKKETKNWKTQDLGQISKIWTLGFFVTTCYNFSKNLSEIGLEMKKLLNCEAQISLFWENGTKVLKQVLTWYLSMKNLVFGVKTVFVTWLGGVLHETSKKTGLNPLSWKFFRFSSFWGGFL